MSSDTMMTRGTPAATAASHHGVIMSWGVMSVAEHVTITTGASLLLLLLGAGVARAAETASTAAAVVDSALAGVSVLVVG